LNYTGIESKERLFYHNYEVSYYIKARNVLIILIDINYSR